MEEIEIDREALLSAFLAESEEIMGRLEHGLVALEASPGDEELLHAVFREAHTLKGLAGMLGLPAVAAAAALVEKRLRLKEDAPPLARNELPLVDLGQALRAALQAVPEITAHLKD